MITNEKLNSFISDVLLKELAAARKIECETKIKDAQNRILRQYTEHNIQAADVFFETTPMTENQLKQWQADAKKELTISYENGLKLYERILFELKNDFFEYHILSTPAEIKEAAILNYKRFFNNRTGTFNYKIFEMTQAKLFLYIANAYTKPQPEPTNKVTFETVLNTLIATDVRNRPIIKKAYKQKFLDFEQKPISFDWYDTDWKLFLIIDYFVKAGHFQYLLDTNLFEFLAKNLTFKGKQKTKNNMETSYNRAKKLFVFTDYTVKLNSIYSNLNIDLQ